ncbi:MAG TPA: hypothetical protein VGC18_00470 [Lacisediminihabitans sp.]|uniref:hypothetical protein n=1 Tax=Lacisediminihabitans sp. TaxID=2787631 RepID=UPI002ED81DE9
MATALNLDGRGGSSLRRARPGARPRGIDRLVILVSIAMLRWARRRADRAWLPYEEHTRLVRNFLERQRREDAARSMIVRVP